MDLFKIRSLLNSGIRLEEINLRVTYYARVSTENDMQLNSLNNQNIHFKEFIKSNKNWEYIDGYVDKGISGTTDIKRQKFMEMIEDAKNNKFDLIVTKEISRFSRNTLDSIKYTRLLLNYGVCVYFLSDNINTIYNDSELRLTIMSSIAQDEIRRLSERVKFGMNRSIKEGHILGNNMLYGYYKSKKTGNLIIKKEEAKIIKKIYELYVYDDYSLTKIVNFLNSKNIKTSMNNSFSITTLKRLIENPKYKGYYCAHKSEVIDYMSKKIKKIDKKDWVIYKDYKKIPPIVDEKLWTLANLKLSKKNNIKIKRSINKYSLKVYCGLDNKLYHRRKLKNDNIWYCSNYLLNGKSNCNNISIHEKDIDNIISIIKNKINLDFNNLKKIIINLIQKDNVENYIDQIIETDSFNNYFINNFIYKISIYFNEIIIFINYNLEKEIEFDYVLKNKKIIVKVKKVI